MNDEAVNFAGSSPWTWRDRLRARLFPVRPVSLPDGPAGADVIEIRTAVRLSWPDLLRVCLTRKLIVQTRTVTQHVVGETYTVSGAYPVTRWPA